MTIKLIRARTQLILDQPFFGSLALRLRLVEDPTVDTAYTDGVVLGYNRRFIQGLNLEQTKWVVAHEVMHLACLHHTRRDGRDPDKWNIAADYAVNSILEDSGFKNPEGVLLDARFTGKSAEAVYAMLPEQERGQPGKMLGEVRDAPSGSLKQLEASWKVAIAQAATQQAKAMGNLSAAIQRLVQRELYPALDYRVLLRHFLEQAVSNDYSWMAPCRRYLASGLCLPGLHSRELGPVVVAGSIDNHALNQFASEISAILDSYDTIVNVVYCDRAVKGHESFERQDLPLKLTPVGGGGTDFRPVFEWVETQEVEPCVLVYLTDLECNRFPEKEPEYPVMWVKTGDCEIQPPFGDVVKLN